MNKGDIIFLKNDTLKSSEGKYLAETRHRFCIVRIKGENLYICPTTTSKTQKQYKNNVEVKFWKEANQNKECIVKTDQISIITEADISKTTGTITKYDLKRIEARYFALENGRKHYIEELNQFDCF